MNDLITGSYNLNTCVTDASSYITMNTKSYNTPNMNSCVTMNGSGTVVTPDLMKLLKVIEKRLDKIEHILTHQNEQTKDLS